jgi:hypothetical protein
MSKVIISEDPHSPLNEKNYLIAKTFRYVGGMHASLRAYWDRRKPLRISCLYGNIPGDNSVLYM